MDTLDYIENVIKKRPAYKDVLTLYQKILEEQDKTKVNGKNISYDIGSPEIIKEKLRNGFPLVIREKINIDFGSSVSLFSRLTKIFEKIPATKDIEKIYSEDKEKLIELMQKVFLGDEESVATVSKEKGINTELLLFLSKLSLQPLGRVLSKLFERYVDQNLWLQGYCPICGAKPDIAEIRGEEGKKYLHCSFCGYVWLFKRLHCPFCGNSDHESLSYFYVEGEEGYRIDVCEKCKKYIKTIDTRKLTERIILGLEDWCTIHLDIIAQNKGYLRESSTHTLQWN